MNCFVIADLHMSGGQNKPMEVFGMNWECHIERIFADWKTRVGENDCVLIPGDISWAMYLDDAMADIDAIGKLPGKKVLLRGNHDYWWSSVAQIRAKLPENMYVVQNDAVDLGEFVVCGSRGWLVPGCGETMTEKDMKVYERECIRLKLSLDAAVRIAGSRPVIVMMHYPPLYPSLTDTGFTRILESFPIIKQVVYGHLHGKGIAAKFEGEHHAISYHLTSCDALDFRLFQLPVQKNEK